MNAELLSRAYVYSAIRVDTHLAGYRWAHVAVGCPSNSHEFNRQSLDFDQLIGPNCFH
jgi:hypothetical protein